MSRFRLPVLTALWIALSPAAHADAADRTDAAFASLLAMPGGQPKAGGWIIPEQDEPTPATETALIARLQKLKKAGADFNAMRHRGTLLAHAIRSGRQRTAIWLLHNGAAPIHVMLNSDQDARSLALTHQRDAVLRELAGRPEFKTARPIPPAAQPPAPPAAQPATRSTPVQQARDLLRRLVSPFLRPDEKAQQAWQTYARQLSAGEYAAVFQDGAHLEDLVYLVVDIDSGLENALGRLPVEWVRARAQAIADILAERSRATFGAPSKIEYTGAALSWPALWKRLDRPLNYDKRPDLAGHLPAAQWKALFASGYPEQAPEVTGCLLSTVDDAGFKALWPDFQRHFRSARDLAPSLVMAGYWQHPACGYASSPQATLAKLNFLRAQGVRGPVPGMRNLRLENPGEAELKAQVASFAPATPAEPQLVHATPTCTLSLGTPWLNALVRVTSVGWGIPPSTVQAVAVPGQDACGLVLSGDQFGETHSIEVSDSLDSGPSREPRIPRCADAPDDGELWIERLGKIQVMPWGHETRGLGFPLRAVVDRSTGRHYLLNSGQQNLACYGHMLMPEAYEWGTRGLQPARDGVRLSRALRDQCAAEAGGSDIVCRGVDAAPAEAGTGTALAALRAGKAVALEDLVGALGTQRRATYQQAIAARDREALRQLHAAGVAPAWTAAEIRALEQAELPLEEKRRRVALLFADASQLDRSLATKRTEMLESLATWLPDQDWGPVLRVIAKAPDLWRDAAEQVGKAANASRHRLSCQLDRALGHLCGGGINPD